MLLTTTTSLPIRASRRSTVSTRAVLAARPNIPTSQQQAAPVKEMDRIQELRFPATEAPIDTRGWISMGLTKATLTELQGIQLNKTINGNTWTVSYDLAVDELLVVDKSRGVRYPAVFGDDNRVKVDVECPIPYATPGLHFSALGQVLRADSKGVELMNGRAAMIGVVAGLVGEYNNQEVIAQQLTSQDGASAAIITGVAVLAASLAPAVVGRVPTQNVFPKPDWPYPSNNTIPYVWTYEAERLNGRLAMLGFTGLLLSEVIAERQCGIITKMLTNWSC